MSSEQVVWAGSKIMERVWGAVRVNKAAVTSRGCDPWRLPVTMRDARTESEREPAAVRVPKQSFLKMTSQRRDCSE